MWSEGGSTNHCGESVLLLEPYSNKPNRKQHGLSQSDPTSSFLGGTAAFFPKDENISKLSQPICRRCGDFMFLVLQMYAPLDEIELDRTMYIFACNKASCINAALSEAPEEKKGFSIGGGGAVCCLRSQCKKDKANKVEKISSDPRKSSNWMRDGEWGEEDDDDNDDDNWGETNEEVALDQIEAMLAKLETEDQSVNKMKSKKTVEKTAMGKIPDNSFPRFELDLYVEPLVRTSLNNQEMDSDDEEDCFVGENDSVKKLLSKYISEEEDESIVSAIKGGNVSIFSNQGGDGEKYERLSPEDRAFLIFTNRVRLAPKQSVRYAFDGVPLWSRPTPLTTKGKRGGQTRDTRFPIIPPCACGSHRSFEFQVMPSVLHVLDVDKYLKSNSDQQSHSLHDLEYAMSKDSGGMNWGCIAVFSCAESCEGNYEEYVIVQESLDGTPQRRQPVTLIDNDDDEDER